MISTSIRHADLMIDFDSAGWVQLTRQSNGQTIQVSMSEWHFLLKCAELRGWPVAPPQPVSVDLSRAYDMTPPDSPR